MTLWDFYPYKASVFLGEVLLDMVTTNLQDEMAWYPINDHDENSTPLPDPSPKPSPRSAANADASASDSGKDSAAKSDERSPWSSVPTLPATPFHDRAKELLHKRILPSKYPFLDYYTV